MKILDGPAIVQMLPPGKCKTFQEYAQTVFIPYVQSSLENIKRLDIVWDVYKANSLKQSVRESRGTGLRRRVVAEGVMPANWKSFLRVDENKAELFHFLSEEVMTSHTNNDKELYCTIGDKVLHYPQRQDVSYIEPCMVQPRRG